VLLVSKYMFSDLTESFRYLRKFKMAAVYQKIQNGVQYVTKMCILTCAAIKSPIVMIFVANYMFLN